MEPTNRQSRRSLLSRRLRCGRQRHESARSARLAALQLPAGSVLPECAGECVGPGLAFAKNRGYHDSCVPACLECCAAASRRGGSPPAFINASGTAEVRRSGRFRRSWGRHLSQFEPRGGPPGIGSATQLVPAGLPLGRWRAVLAAKTGQSGTQLTAIVLLLGLKKSMDSYAKNTKNHLTCHPA